MSAKKPMLNGKPSSRNTEPHWANEIATPGPELKKLLAAIYNNYQTLDDPAANEQCRHDFVFHMTDWLNDLRRLADLYAQPDRFDRKAAEDAVAGFLYHVTAHLMEAARLALDYEPGYIFDSPKPKGEPPVTTAPSRKRRKPSPSPR